MSRCGFECARMHGSVASSDDSDATSMGEQDGRWYAVSLLSVSLSLSFSLSLFLALICLSFSFSLSNSLFLSLALHTCTWSPLLNACTRVKVHHTPRRGSRSKTSSQSAMPHTTPFRHHSQVLQGCEGGECGAGDAGDGVVAQPPSHTKATHEHAAKETIA